MSEYSPDKNGRELFPLPTQDQTMGGWAINFDYLTELSKRAEEICGEELNQEAIEAVLLAYKERSAVSAGAPSGAHPEDRVGYYPHKKDPKQFPIRGAAAVASGETDYKVLWERYSVSLGKCLQEIHTLRAVKEDQRAKIVGLERELAGHVEALKLMRQQAQWANERAEKAEDALRSATGERTCLGSHPTRRQRGDMEIAFLILIAIGFLIWFVSGASNDSNWTNDCDRLGAHVVRGKVYECKLRT